MWKINISGKGAEGNRIRTFGIYALCVILFFIFSNIMIEVALKATYDPIDTYITQPEGMKIEINESKATYVNGYVGGNITHTNDVMSVAYVKIDLYTKRNVCMGTKYVELNHLIPYKAREFRMGFQYNDVDYARITVVDEIPENTPEEAFESENLAGPMLIAAVIFLCFFG